MAYEEYNKFVVGGKSLWDLYLIGPECHDKQFKLVPTGNGEPAYDFKQESDKRY